MLLAVRCSAVNYSDTYRFIWRCFILVWLWPYRPYQKWRAWCYCEKWMEPATSLVSFCGVSQSSCHPHFFIPLLRFSTWRPGKYAREIVSRMMRILSKCNLSRGIVIDARRYVTDPPISLPFPFCAYRDWHLESWQAAMIGLLSKSEKNLASGWSLQIRMIRKILCQFCVRRAGPIFIKKLLGSLFYGQCHRCHCYWLMPLPGRASFPYFMAH